MWGEDVVIQACKVTEVGAIPGDAQEGHLALPVVVDQGQAKSLKLQVDLLLHLLQFTCLGNASPSSSLVFLSSVFHIIVAFKVMFLHW